jgi:ABC-2 type transport system permease protein
MRAYITQIRTNLRLTMRDRTMLFFNYMFPLVFFFIFGFMMHAEQGGAIVGIVNMVLVIGILGGGFFGAGMRTVMDREANILRRFKVAPITAGPILVSQMVVGLVHFIPVTVLVLVLAHFVYGMPPLEHPGSLFVFVLIGVLAFRAMGGIIGAVANSMQESQIIIQLLYFPMLFLGGATFPIAIMPNWLQIVAQFIPTTYLTTGITSILEGHETIWNNLAPAGALLLTAAVGTFLALKLFRWEKRREDAHLGEILADRGAGAVYRHGRVAGVFERQPREGKDAGPRNEPHPHASDSRRAFIPGRWQRHRAGRGADQGRQDRRNLYGRGSRPEDGEG